ncbi:MAG: hypothetical protein ACPGPF_01575 [Pontibacterium sp.]
MTYTTDAAKLSREPLNIVRIDLDTKISGTYEYICDGISPPNNPPIYSCVKSIEWVPQRTDPDGGLGYLGEVVINAVDFDWPGGAGTYFGRLLANNPYFLNRKVKIYSGFLARGDSFSLANFQERDYFIRDITGPDAKGKVQIKAADILSQTKEATMPRKTNGILESALNTTETPTDLGITDETGFSSTGWAIINDEIVSYSDAAGANDINLTNRGQAGTDAASHAIGDPVRYVEKYSGNVVDIIEDIIQNHTDIDDTTYINSTDWTNEKNNYLSGENVELWVTEPTTVDKVLDQLCKQTYINLFWDDVNQEIKLKAIGPTLTPATQWNDTANILDTKITIKRPQKNIYSQCWVYYGKINKAGSDQASNYKSLHILANTDIETGLGTDNIKRIYGAHLPDNASATASKVASRFVAQHSNPIDIQFEVDTKDQESLETGDSVEITTDLIQGTDGLASTILLRVIEKRALDNNRWRYRCVFSGAEVGSRYPLVGPNTLVDYGSESTANQNTYGFICDNDNEMLNGDDPYLIL